MGHVLKPFDPAKRIGFGAAVRAWLQTVARDRRVAFLTPLARRREGKFRTTAAPLASGAVMAFPGATAHAEPSSRSLQTVPVMTENMDEGTDFGPVIASHVATAADERGVRAVPGGTGQQDA